MSDNTALSPEMLVQKINFVRGHKVMLDALEVLQNQWVVGRVLTRHVGLKPDIPMDYLG